MNYKIEKEELEYLSDRVKLLRDLTERICNERVARQKLHEFIKYGLHVVFPILPGPIATGMLTAHSHPFYQEQFSAYDIYVWPDINGAHRGQSILPLYKGATIAAQNDENLYKLLASIDILRVGRPREINAALGVIENYIL